MNYNIFDKNAPAMPQPSRGTEFCKLLLSQASKDMREPLVPMAMPALASHLTDVEFTCTEDTLAPEDIIVIVSDGAVVCGEEWIERIILQWQDKSMQELAHLINDEATARRTDGHDDDITVLALRIKQAA